MVTVATTESVESFVILPLLGLDVSRGSNNKNVHSARTNVFSNAYAYICMLMG